MYNNFNEAKKKLTHIQAIDFFFAKEVLSLISFQNMKLSNSVKNILFHLLVELMSAYNIGHSCIIIKELSCKKLFFIENNEIESMEGYILPHYKEMIDILNSIDYTKLPVYFSKEFSCLYIRKMWCYEKEISLFIRQNTVKRININDYTKINNILSILFHGVEAQDYQKKAIINSFKYDFSIISGGPGTGKTTIVSKLLLAIQMFHFNSKKPRISLLSPTGKAAQQMTESLRKSLTSSRLNILNGAMITWEYLSYLQNLESQTIHRFLGLRPNSKYIKYNQESKAPYDLIIVDEASMLDINIFIKLIRSIHQNTKLILLGDVNQIPSVEVGSILSSLTTDIRGNLPKYVTTLLKNYRSKQDIHNFANSVLIGDISQLNYKGNNINFYNSYDMDKLLITYAYKYKDLEKCINYKEALHILSQFRILVANKHFDIGTDNLNHKIEKICGKTPGSNYKAKAIMITQNNYSLGLFNGDIGIMWPDNIGNLKVYFDSKNDRSFSLNMLPNYETAYVMTIHKTQGSEFDEVVIILPDNYNAILTKELIYTAITRAKIKVDIISEAKIFNKVIKKSVTRNSNIKYLIG